jgi:carbon-monoxide dehydrogenase medium subunit
MMGGTDLFPGLRDDRVRPDVVIDVKWIPGLQDITYDPDSGLVIGAAVTMNQLACHREVLDHAPLLAEAASSVASYQVRNRATIGGNLCNASPCADMSPAVLVLEAQMVLFSSEGERAVPAAEFFVGPGQTVLGPGEFLVEVRFPQLPRGLCGRYLKLGRQKAGDLALVGVAVLGYADAAVPSGYGFRIGLGSVAPVPLRAREAEPVLAGSWSTAGEAFAEAADHAMGAATPISDVRGGAEYQKAMVRNLTLRGLSQVWQKLAGSQ